VARTDQFPVLDGRDGAEEVGGEIAGQGLPGPDKVRPVAIGQSGFSQGDDIGGPDSMTLGAS
jgi:hypothetical protein